MSGMPGAFTTTIWDTIRQAKMGEPEAVERILKKYREPVVAFIRGRGHSPEDAEDLAQDVFLVIVRDDLLAKAERERGRFRDFLRGVVKNVLANAGRVRRAAKRGAGAEPLPLDEVLGDPEAREQDEAFDSEWIRNLVALSLDRLRESDERYHRALSLQRDEGRSLEEIASAMNVSAKQVGNFLQQARKKLGEFIRREVQGYCSSSAELRDEVAYLKKFLAAGEKA